MVELYINDGLVDLIGDESIAVDYAVFDINDIGARTGARSYQFALPKTKTNKGILETPEAVNNLSGLPYIKLKARLYVNGVDSNIRFAHIESVNETYNLRLYGNNPDFFADAKSVDLRDLDFCDYDHYWTYERVAASFTNTEGYIYPIIDYIADSPNSIINNIFRKISASRMLPATFNHTVLDKIGEYFGITIVDKVKDTTNFPVDNLILPFSKEVKVRNRNPERYTARFTLNADFVPDTPLPPYPGIPGVSQGVWLSFDNVSVPCGSYWHSGNYSESYLKFAERVKFKLRYRIVLDADFYPSTFSTSAFITTNYKAPFIFDILKGGYYFRNDTNIIEQYIDFSQGQQVLEGEYEFITEKTDGNGFGFPADSLMIFFVWAGGLPSPVIMRQESYIELVDVEILEDGEVTYSDTDGRYNYVTMSSMLPDWDCAEFIKQYCLQFSAIPIYNSVEKKLTIIPFDSILSNIPKAYDWSAKVDRALQSELQFNYLDYAQINHLKYADEVGLVKPNGTDGIIAINNPNLEGQFVAVELLYGATTSVIRLIDIEIPQIKAWYDGGAQFTPNVQPRIMVLKRYSVTEFDDTSQLQIDRDGIGSGILVSSNIPIPYFIKFGEAFNLGFEDNIIESYFVAIMGILGNIKALTEPIRLTISDINQLDFLRPVWLSQHSAYFYISRVSSFEYTLPSTTDVELIKLNL